MDILEAGPTGISAMSGVRTSMAIAAATALTSRLATPSFQLIASSTGGFTARQSCCFMGFFVLIHSRKVPGGDCHVHGPFTPVGSL